MGKICGVRLIKMELKKLQDLTELGAFDEYGIIQEPPKDPILKTRIQRILDSPLEKD